MGALDVLGPFRGYQYRVGPLPILDADGDLVTAATALDTEISKDFGTFADATNEATEVATSSGMYYIDLSATEMTAATVAGISKTTSAGAKTTPWALFPIALIQMATGTAQAGAAGTITLASGSVAVDAFYAGLYVGIASATGVGQIRRILSYVGATKVATISPAWTTTPDATSVYEIVAPTTANVTGWAGVLPTVPNTAGTPIVDVTRWLGTTVATPGTAGVPSVDVIRISGDATAADNLEAYSDGTTPQPVNVTHWIGTAAATPAVAGRPSVDAIALSGDTTAADNLELMFDGTGYAGGTIKLGVDVVTVEGEDAINSDTAQAYTTTTIDLAAGASGEDDTYNGQGVFILSATTGAQQLQVIDDYTGSTRRATLRGSFAPALSGTVRYQIVAQHVAAVVNVQVTGLNNDVISAAALAADAVTEIQAGLAMAAALATVDDFLDTEIAALTTNLATANTNITTIDDLLDTELPALTTAVDALPTNAELATALGTADDATLAAIAALTIPTATAISDVVWDELLSGHVVAGSTGNALAAAGAADDPWTTALPGAYGAGTAGKLVGDNINATVGSRATQTSVDDLPTNAELVTSQASADDATLAAIAALNNLSSVQAQTSAAAALTAYDSPTHAELVSGLTGNVTAILTTAMTESYASVNAAPSIAQALMLIQQTLGDFAINGTTLTVRNLAGTAVATFTLNDGTIPTAIERAT